MMNIEDMQKIWSEQTNSYMYAIDEERLHQNISKKKSSGSRLVNKLEWVAIGSTILAGAILFFDLYFDEYNLFKMILGLYMLAAAGYVYLRRLKRLKGENNFERTMLGDLNHAISNAKYQVGLSFFLIAFFVTVCFFTSIASWQEDKPMWMKIGILVFFVLALIASLIEHKKIHLSRLKRLEKMLDKLLMD